MVSIHKHYSFTLALLYSAAFLKAGGFYFKAYRRILYDSTVKMIFLKINPFQVFTYKMLQSFLVFFLSSSTIIRNSKITVLLETTACILHSSTLEGKGLLWINPSQQPNFTQPLTLSLHSSGMRESEE